MTILVTGGAGYIGSHMVLELLDSGENVVVLDNLSTGFRWAVPVNATLVVGDIGDQELVRSIVRKHGVKSIIHFAGSIVVPESVVDPLGYYHNNTAKSRALMEVAVEMGIENFIFSSTAAVYGMPKEVPVREDAALAPMSPYGSSKLMTEIMLADTARAHNFRYVALRYFNVAGADPKGRSGQSTPNATHLIKVACEAALGKRPYLEVFGTDYDTPDGTGVRDYIHVDDLAAAHIHALEKLIAHPAESYTLNCGYGRGFSVLEVLDAVDRATNAPIARILAPRRAGDPDALTADNSAILETLPWRPKLDDLDTIIAHALAWERQLGDRP
jgi:UDP-glucose 4-epimerase